MLRRIFLITLYLLTLSPLIGSRHLQANELELHVSVLSAGYADCTLLKLPNGKNVMIDAGSTESAEKILAELKARDVRAIDLLLITHFHDNHYGGLSQFVDQFKIETLAIPFSAKEPPDFTRTREQLMKLGTQVILVERGNQIELDPEVDIEVLHPNGTVRDPNADSIVLWIGFRKTTLLFPADITPEIQNQLLPNLKRLGKIGFVLLPHHGGDLDRGFAKRIRKAIKVISTGPSNWVSPVPETLARFGENLHRTDLHGTLQFKTDGIKISQVEHAQETLP